jgi:hypothetical protein
MPLRLERRIEYRIPTAPKKAPKAHVQMIFASAFMATATMPATNQLIVPIATRVTTRRIFDSMREE